MYVWTEHPNLNAYEYSGPKHSVYRLLLLHWLNQNFPLPLCTEIILLAEIQI